MSNWSKILVYADGRPESKLAIREAIRLAEHVGGKATALDVLHYFPARLPPSLADLNQLELLRLMKEQRREQLLEEIGSLGAESIVDVMVTQGQPAFELISLAMRGNHGLIVKAARGRDVNHVTSFGSTALHLVRKSPMPVLLVSPRPVLLEVPKVLCALELDEADGRDGFNRKLLASSRQLAEVHGADLHVLHVVDSQRTAAYRTFLSADTFDRFATDRRRLLRDDMENLLASELDATRSVHAHLLEGDPADHIVKMLNVHRFSHLVMGSVARCRAGHFVGRLAEDVLTRVDCSVLMVKPGGFESPIGAGVLSAA
ncbi:MAG: universal stress protein [Polyangiaceae bacterium]|jgi:nucleotide-binding universal stress UspA family protein|nr:universal stress protein [Polyangiaceae bacterium]